MAKPKTRIDRSAIASMLGMTPATDLANDSARPAESNPADVVREAPEDQREGEGLHPVRDRFESGVARAENALVLDPRRVAQRGRYVRPFTDDQRFSELLNAIEEAGRTIHVPILVRVEGAPGSIEYVLVDGTHRLEAALRLGISLPAINLGRISPERAFAIQAMANEVRATMHVVDQAAYVLVLEAQGLNRESIQRTTGFSAGRVSELAALGKLLGTLGEKELARARLASTVTHRALRSLKAAAADAKAFGRGVGALIAQAETAKLEDGEADTGQFRSDGSLKPVDGKTSKELGSPRYQLGTRAAAGRRRQGRTALEAGGVSFATTRNRRGTSVTFRMAWRARGIRQNPEAFLERVREALREIASQATVQFKAATALEPPRSQSGDKEVGSFGGSWPDPLSAAVLEAGEQGIPLPVASDPTSELVMPEWQNPMPIPASQRQPDDTGPQIDPRLLGGLSLPMLSGRLKRRSAEFKQLEKLVSDAERKAEDTRQRVRGLIDAEDVDLLNGQ